MRQMTHQEKKKLSTSQMTGRGSHAETETPLCFIWLGHSYESHKGRRGTAAEIHWNYVLLVVLLLCYITQPANHYQT